MAYSKAKLKSNGDRASPCFRPFLTGNAPDKLLYYLTIYVSKLPCRTHTKSNWKWILKYADCDV
jgi:hypothetical protein